MKRAYIGILAAFLAAFLLPALGYTQDISNPYKLGSGLTAGTAYNPGTQTAPPGSTINGQLVYRAETANCVVNAGPSGGCSPYTNDGGFLITFTGPGLSGTLPNPGPPGSQTYSFGYDGVNPYSITTIGDSAVIHSCGTAGATISGLTYQTTFVPEGSEWQCVPSSAGSTSPAGITPVARASCQNAGAGETLTCTIPSTTAGKGVSFALFWCSNSACTATITTSVISVIACSGAGPCSAGDTCTQVPSAQSPSPAGNIFRVDTWNCPTTAAGDTAVTAALNGSSDNYFAIVSQSWSTASVVDGTAGASGPAGSSLTTCSATMGAATVATNDAIFAVSADLTSVVSPFTLNTTTPIATAYWSDPGATPASVTFNTGSATGQACSVAAFAP